MSSDDLIAYIKQQRQAVAEVVERETVRLEKWLWAHPKDTISGSHEPQGITMLPTIDLEPGPELDARVAKACGMEVRSETRHRRHDWSDSFGGNYYGSGHICSRCGDAIVADDLEYEGRGECVVVTLFNPSTNLIDAFAAAEKCGLFHHVRVFLSKDHPDGWCVQQTVIESHEEDCILLGSAPTPALAICRAIVKVCDAKT